MIRRDVEPTPLSVLLLVAFAIAVLAEKFIFWGLYEVAMIAGALAP